MFSLKLTNFDRIIFIQYFGQKLESWHPVCLEKRVLVKLDSQNVCCWASFWGRILSNKACTLLAFLLFQLRRARDAIKVRGGQVRNFAHMKNARCQSYTLENWLESWWWSAFVRLWHTRNYRISCLSNQHFFYFFANQ